MSDVNGFLPIIDTWPEYFENPYEGLGTTYERVLLHAIFEKIDRAYNIQSVLETPSFGMTGISGINSLWWGKHQKEIYLVDDNEARLDKIKKVWASLGFPFIPVLNNINQVPLEDDSVDLTWNFASLWFLQDLDYFAEQVKRVTRKVILISVPNHLGMGFLIRRGAARQLSQLNLQYCKPRVVRKAFEGQGWVLWDKGIFDVPPWPDIPMKKEDLFKRLGIEFLLKYLPQADDNSNGETPESILDYFSGKNPNLDKEILKYGIIEKAPRPFSTFWGHHRYFIFVKEGA
ncbi:MAG TPA: methyltransferase domain-containing protein [Calditrichia bacterium]|nr:methyltransferase domain-containing protein [Calditrichota bacterium]HQU73808.1 methyltransferase domain-containing protein [Calditrichia bacterium]HQV32711.1 methyltransferase domain-containing protein [Calditrichia bacterium]